MFANGALGYVGGSVLQRLLEHPKKDSFEITALVRSADKAKLLNTLGINTVVASLADLDKLTESAAASDVVIHTADADDEKAARALLRGAKARYDKTGKIPTYIHTSGTGVLMDNAAGLQDTDVIYVDTNVKQIESLPDTAPHRKVDLAVVAADKDGYVRTYIVLPSTIYGIATGKLFNLGISNAYSIQVPIAIKASLDRGKGGMIGQGKNLWPIVEVHEQAELYQIILDAALSDPNTPHGREGFYFGASDEYRLYDLAKAYSQALYDLGKGKSPDPTPFTAEEAQKYFGGTWLGHNARCRAERGRALGWRPTKTTKDFLESVRPEVEAIIAQK
jgi:nucleoside-diphosphate-sugar epimerase